MNQQLSSFLSGKPQCFGLPEQSNPVRPQCEKCGDAAACVGTIHAIHDYVRNKNDGSSPRLTTGRHLATSIDYWDGFVKPAQLSCSLPLLGALVQRAEHHRDDAVLQTVRSSTVVSSDQVCDDAHLDELPGELHDIPDDTARLKTGSVYDETCMKPTPGKAAHGVSSEAHANPHSSDTDPVIENLLDDCCDALEDASDGSSEILTSDEYDAVDALLDQIPTNALNAIAAASAKTKAAPVPASSPGFASIGVHVTAPALSADHEQLMADLVELLHAFNAAGLRDYTAIRERFIALNFQLNQHGRWAPRFRKIPYQIADSGHVATQYLVDRQLVDLHWLWATRQRKPCSQLSYETMLCAEPFDRPTVERFAQEVWHLDTKATYLNLSTKQQWQLCAIQSEAVRKRWSTIKDGDRQGGKVRQNGAAQVEATLQDRTIPQHRMYIPSRVAVWIAVSICGKKKWTEAARLCALILGEEKRDPSQIQKAFDVVEKALAKAKA